MAMKPSVCPTLLPSAATSAANAGPLLSQAGDGPAKISFLPRLLSRNPFPAHGCRVRVWITRIWITLSNGTVGRLIQRLNDFAGEGQALLQRSFHKPSVFASGF